MEQWTLITTGGRYHATSDIHTFFCSYLSDSLNLWLIKNFNNSKRFWNYSKFTSKMWLAKATFLYCKIVYKFKSNYKFHSTLSNSIKHRFETPKFKHHTLTSWARIFIFFYFINHRAFFSSIFVLRSNERLSVSIPMMNGVDLRPCSSDKLCMALCTEDHKGS